MATIRHKPGRIAASDLSRTSYKAAFLRGAVAEESSDRHSLQVIDNERRIEMREEQVYRQSLQMAHLCRESLAYPYYSWPG